MEAKVAYHDCPCCGKKRRQDWQLRCGAGCTARHEAKECLCYKKEQDDKHDQG